MNCNEVIDNLSLYIDDELNEEEKRLYEEHLNSCEACRNLIEEYKNLIAALNNLPDEEPPVGYCKRLHKKLLETNKADKFEATIITDISKKKRNNSFKWVKYGGLAASLVLVLLVYSLNNHGFMNKSSNEMAYDSQGIEYPQIAPQEAPMEMEILEQNDDYKQSENISVGNRNDIAQDVKAKYNLAAVETRELKIIKTGNLYVQTRNYNKFLDEISLKVNSLGGFIENNSTEIYHVYNNEKLMRGSLKLRVPQEVFYDTIAFLEQSTDLRRKSINENDVTKEYYEKDNKVRNLEVQEEHLRELFDKATTVEEMLQIENELRRIRTEIDSLNISLADIDDRAAMSTIDLEVEEVKEVNFSLQGEKSVWERAKEGFIYTVNQIVKSIGDLLVSIIASTPVLVPDRKSVV